MESIKYLLPDNLNIASLILVILGLAAFLTVNTWWGALLTGWVLILFNREDVLDKLGDRGYLWVYIIWNVIAITSYFIFYLFKLYF
jgi:uncharacterized membrane protein